MRVAWVTDKRQQRLLCPLKADTKLTAGPDPGEQRLQVLVRLLKLILKAGDASRQLSELARVDVGQVVTSLF